MLRTDPNAAWKQRAVDMFVAEGREVSEIAAYYACHKLRVEQAIREALRGMAALVSKQAQQDKES